MLSSDQNLTHHLITLHLYFLVDSGVKWQTFLVTDSPNTGPRFVHRAAAQFGQPTEFIIKVCKGNYLI